MSIREAAFAGQFYPANPKELRRTISNYSKKSESLQEAKAVLVPHAGYIYSGSVAASVYSAVRLPNRVIIMGPNHTGRGSPLSLFPAGAWNMPLGAVSIDAELNRCLLAECPNLQEDRAAHEHEHSLEVQIPFLQVMLPEFSFAAICIAWANYSDLETLGHGMARVIHSWQEPILIIVSSDMTHYESADVAAKQDRLAIDQILAVDPSGLYKTVIENNISMCGVAPAVAALVTCRDLGASGGELIRYGNSGDAMREYGRVVAYAGLAIL